MKIATSFLAFLLVPFLLNAQCDEGCDSLIQASTQGVLIGLNPDSTADLSYQISKDSVGPMFQYDYETDSSHVQWTFGEFLFEGKKLVLSNWCLNRILNYDDDGDTVITEWNQSQLNNRSITKTFPISTGDTVGFYRVCWLKRRGYSGAAYDYYKNPDVLSYSVELVDSSSGSRIALLDTSYYGTTNADRKPCIVSWYPMYSRVKYVMPSGYSNELVYLRINTFSSGATAKSWVRSDLYRLFGSRRHLNSSLIQDYCESIEDNISCNVSPSCDLVANPVSSPSGIEISLANPTQLTTVKIFDVYGSIYWSGSVPLGSNPYTVSISSGLYIVVAYENAQVICTQKVYVQ